MRNAALRAVGRLLRAVPDSMPGKTRIAGAFLAPFGKGPAVVEGDFGLVYHCPSLAEPIARGIAAEGLYERATHRALCSRLPENGVFLDIGANIGAISLPVARARPAAKVFAIEASPAIAGHLAANITLNHVENVTVLNLFASAEDGGETEFFEAPDEKFGMGSAGAQFGSAPVMLPERSVDAMIADRTLLPPDVIKLDIEGGEYAALQGCRALLESPHRPRAVIFEFADWAEARIGLSPGASQELMLSHGYRLSDLARPELAFTEPMRTGAAMVLALA